MGGAASFTITSFPFFLTITTTLIILIHPSTAGFNDESNQNGIPVVVNDDEVRPPPAAAHVERKSATLKPGAAVVVGVLTTTFSLSFLLLLYIKHCNGGGNTSVADQNPHGAAASSGQRKHSGVEREVVESLPMFRFGSLRGRRNGLDCAVCLTGFEDREVLRLLPKCKHAFHVGCVDTWLNAHSTCPLCRDKVHREDGALVEEEAREDGVQDIERGRRNNNNGSRSMSSAGNENRRGSGSYSSAGGEGDGEFLDIVLETPNNDADAAEVSASSFRGSLEVLEDAVESPGKSGRPLGEHRLEHRIIISPGAHEERSDSEPFDVLYLKSEMIISGGRRRTVSEHKQDVRSDETTEEDGVSRSVSEPPGMNRFVRGKNREEKESER